MVMSTHIHNSSCSHRHPQFIMFTHWPCLHTSTIHHVHTMAMSTHIHNLSCSHQQTSTIHHVHILAMSTHIHNLSGSHRQTSTIHHVHALAMSTHIHNSCLHQQTSTIHHFHALAMSTHIHNSLFTSTDIHNSLCLHQQTSTIHHVHTSHVYTHSRHHVHIDRHPPFIMFTYWPCLQTSRNTKYPQLPDQKCSPFHILTNRFTFQVHYPGGMNIRRTNMRSVTLCQAFRQ